MKLHSEISTGWIVLFISILLSVSGSEHMKMGDLNLPPEKSGGGQSGHVTNGNHNPAGHDADTNPYKSK